jgi:hypothetical protein
MCAPQKGFVVGKTNAISLRIGSRGPNGIPLGPRERWLYMVEQDEALVQWCVTDVSQCVFRDKSSRFSGEKTF